MSNPDGGDELGGPADKSGETIDGGWEDGDGGGEGAGEGAAEANSSGEAAGAPGDAPRRKRRRRRRGRGERQDAPQGQASGGPPPAGERLEGDPYAAGTVEAQTPAGPTKSWGDRFPQQPQSQQQQQPRAQPQQQPQQPRAQPQQQRGPRPNEQRSRRERNPQRQPGLQPTESQRGGRNDRHDRGGRDRGRRERNRDDAPPVDLAEDDVEAQNDLRTRAENAAAAPVPGSSVGGALKHAARPRGDEDEDEAPAPPGEAWGTDDGTPAAPIALKSDFAPEPPATDPDPATFALLDEPGARFAGEDVASVVGVRFVPAGRISWFDASDVDYAPGERVVVDAERGGRLGWIATAPVRRSTRDRNLRRVMRRANEQDLRGESAGDDNRVRTLRMAKDKAAQLRLPLKVFRVETGGGKLIVYYTSDDRLDLRDFVRELSQGSGLRPELRQLGVRDEAKAVGGIGSCGLTLCCTTWLPDFVPVSIKMAKDQGLVLSPTKVSGQCGRLKCCLVYEQAAYAELRKGLPKLGKRVVGARGEGRVVEVDVLRQRLRVSYGPGDTEVVPATEVKPLFPAGNQPPREGQPRSDRRDDRRDQPRRGTTPRPQQPDETVHDDRDAQIAALQAAHSDLHDDDDGDDDMPDPSRNPELDALEDDDPSRDPNAED